MSRSYPAIALIAVVAGLALSPPAHAKGIARLAVCGPGVCVDRTQAALDAAPDPHLLLDAGTPVADDSVAAEPFVRLRIGVGDGTSRKVYGRYMVAFLPRSGHMRSADGGWSILPSDARRTFRRLTAGVPRFPGSRLRLVATDPATSQATTTAPATAGAGGGDGPGGSDGGWPWLGTGVLAVAAAAAAGVVIAWRRRVRRYGPAV